MTRIFKVLNTVFYIFIGAMVFPIITGTFGIVGPKTTHAEENHAMDIVFVIDNSGSMKKNDPKFMTPKVVSTFVRKLANDTQVAIVLFDQKARLLNPLTFISDSKGQQKIIDSLKKIDYRGQYTNTPVGIERALYELKINGRGEAQKGIIFVTDGIVDTGNKAKDIELTNWLKQEIAAKSKTMGIRIFGIALTEAADFSLIQTLASNTGGEYFRTFKADEISGVLEQIKVHMTPTPAPEKPTELAQLPLLPVPDNKPESKGTGQAQPEKSDETVKVEPPKENDGEGAKAEKKDWKLGLSLALIIIALVGALVFFFFQSIRSKQSGGPVAAKTPPLPDAEIENIDNILQVAGMPFKIDKEMTNIGRSQRNDLIIQEPAVSSFHATIEFRNMYFYLEDQRSTNGTIINERRLAPNEPVRLKSGDVISIAKFKFKFIMEEQVPFGDTVLLGKTELEDPDAEATIVLDLQSSNSKQGLMACIQNHLIQIYGLSPKHKDYVNTYFSAETLDIITTTAHKNLSDSVADSEQHCTPMIKNQAFFIVCSLPVSIDTAVQWFSDNYGGFTQFIFQWIRSEQYKTAQCEQLCIVTFGMDPATWVSITIVPTHSDPDPIEIMSVDFLDEEEKASLALDFDNHGRVI